MALIKCRECGNEVSEKAATCPKCGNPIASAIETAAAGTPIVTTQATAKKFKSQILLATMLMIGGCAAIFSGISNKEVEFLHYGTLAFIIGGFWFLIARARSWWHHG